MKVKRILSGVIGFPIVAAVLILGNKYIIDVLFAAITILSLNEYFNAFKEKGNPVSWLGYISALVISIIHIIDINYLLIIIPIIVALLFLQVVLTKMKTNCNDIAITLLGILYIVGFLIFMPLLYGTDNGKFLVWYILLIAWGTDTFAYLIGCKFGKHKLTEISPKKSVEGSIAGIVGSMILALVYTFVIKQYIELNVSYIYIAAVALILSILSQIGDLAASTIKRYTGIKDFGNLIPGHGGMMDRIDSIIFIAPFAYLLLTII